MVAGVGIMVAERWVDNVIEVRRVSGRLLILRVTIGKSVMNLVSAYAPQVNRDMEEKEAFLALLGKTLSGISGNEKVMVFGDFNCPLVLVLGVLKVCMVDTVLESEM